MNENIVLSGRSIYSQTQLRAGKSELDKNNQPYKMLWYNGMPCYLTGEALTAYQEGQMAELTLVSTTSKVALKDPESGEAILEADGVTPKTTEIPAVDFGGFISYKQTINIVRNEATLEAVKLQVIKEFKLDAEPVI